MFPDPLTTARHWLVPPEVMVAGEQVTVTVVTLGEPLPQADSNASVANTTSKLNLPTSSLFIGFRSPAHRSAALLEGKPVREMRADDRFAGPPGWESR